MVSKRKVFAKFGENRLNWRVLYVHVYDIYFSILLMVKLEEVVRYRDTSFKSDYNMRGVACKAKQAIRPVITAILDYWISGG